MLLFSPAILKLIKRRCVCRSCVRLTCSHSLLGNARMSYLRAENSRRAWQGKKNLTTRQVPNSSPNICTSRVILALLLQSDWELVLELVKGVERCDIWNCEACITWCRLSTFPFHEKGFIEKERSWKGA